METTTTSPLLKLQGLSASVGDKPILHDIDLAIGAHETHVMMARTAPANRRSAM